MEGSAVFHCSVPDLFLRLSRSILAQAMLTPAQIYDWSYLKPTKQLIYAQDPKKTRWLFKQLTSQCLDMVLLKQYEWQPLSSTTGCPVSRCLGLSLTLRLAGLTKEADMLTAAIESLATGNSNLTEVDSILQFLFLLSNKDTEQILSCSGSCDLEADINTTISMTTKLFECQPGLGFNGFMVQVPHAESTALFGGLVHSNYSNFNINLELPCLPSDHKHISLLPSKHDSCAHVRSAPVQPPEEYSDNSPLLAMATVDLLRGWEGWLSDMPFLCDVRSPALYHATSLLVARYAELAGVLTPTLADPIPPCQAMLRAIDHLPNPPLQPVMETDHVLFSMLHCLRCLLASCRTRLFPSEPDLTFLQKEHSTYPILPLTQLLLELIPILPQMERFELMESLYRQAEELQGTPHYFFFLGLLSQALLSYLRVVEQWIFRGHLDPNQWIGISTDEGALTKRDDSYWKNGFVLPDDTCTPSFLSHLSRPILACGKALNLLQLCLPQHPISTGKFSHPPLELIFTAQQLMEFEGSCEVYTDQVMTSYQLLAKQIHQRRLDEEEKEHAVAVQACQEARKEGIRLRELEKQQFISEVHRKHSLALGQKAEMERLLALRSQRAAEEKQADKILAATLSQQEEAWKEREAKLKHEARLELERHYEDLSLQVEERRARAEWRLARLQLSAAREALWKKELAEEQKAIKEGHDSQQQIIKDKEISESYELQERPLQFPNGGVIEGKSHVGDSQSPQSPNIGSIQSTGSSTDGNIQSSRPPNIGDIQEMPPQPPNAQPPSIEERPPQPPNIEERSPRPASIEERPPQPPNIEERPAQPPSIEERSPLPPSIEERSPLPPSIEERSPLPPSVRDVHSVGNSSNKSELAGIVKDERDPHLISTEESLKVGVIQDAGDPRLISTRGHAPPSTIQHLLNPLQYSDSSQSHEIQSPNGVNVPTLNGVVQDAGDPCLLSTRGHAPPSTIQHLINPVQYPDNSQSHEVQSPNRVAVPTLNIPPPPKYCSDFSILGDPPLLDSLLNIGCDDHKEIDLNFLSLWPLPCLLKHSIEQLILTQSYLVNHALLDYLVSHCQLHQHFLALKRFLLLEDGEFGHALSTKLFEQLSFGEDCQFLCSSAFLNPLLTSALEASCQGMPVSVASHLSFSLRYRPQLIHSNAIKVLSFLELKYKVEWPCNIVITSTSLHKYNQILQFLLEMKRSSWIMKHTFHHLKECNVLGKFQLRQLQIYRHEFQHFVNIMHGYIVSQLFGITWKEFQVELTQQCSGLDDVIQAHNKFIDQALFRCLLSKKAKPVMNLIYDLLASILTFSTQVAELGSSRSQRTYSVLCTTHDKFRDTCRLLISVLGKLIARGYQPHLEELLLRLNFNTFY